MIFEMTTQFRVSNMEEGQKWYEILLHRKPMKGLRSGN